MKRLIAIAALGVALTGCTIDEIETWLAWRTVDPVAADTYAALPSVQEHLRVDWDNDGVMEPDPPPPTTVPAAGPRVSASASGTARG